MISDLSPGDKLSLKGKIFELQKKLQIIDIRNKQKEEFSYKPTLYNYSLPDRHSNVLESINKAEIIRKQRKEMLEAAVLMQNEEGCTFAPVITRKSRAQPKDSRPVHVRLTDQGKYYSESLEKLRDNVKRFDDSGRKLFTPAINREPASAQKPVAHTEKAFAPAEEVSSKCSDQQDASELPPPPAPPASAAKHPPAHPPPAAAAAADEFLYQDARDREERYRMRERELQSQIEARAAASKMNASSMTLLRRKAEREARLAFRTLSGGCGESSDNASAADALAGSLGIDDIQSAMRWVYGADKWTAEATARHVAGVWGLLDFRQKGSVKLEEFLQAAVPLLLHTSVGNALLEFQAHTSERGPAVGLAGASLETATDLQSFLRRTVAAAQKAEAVPNQTATFQPHIYKHSYKLATRKERKERERIEEVLAMTKARALLAADHGEGQPGAAAAVAGPASELAEDASDPEHEHDASPETAAPAFPAVSTELSHHDIMYARALLKQQNLERMAREVELKKMEECTFHPKVIPAMVHTSAARAGRGAETTADAVPEQGGAQDFSHDAESISLAESSLTRRELTPPRGAGGKKREDIHQRLYGLKDKMKAGKLQADTSPRLVQEMQACTFAPQMQKSFHHRGDAKPVHTGPPTEKAQQGEMKSILRLRAEHEKKVRKAQEESHEAQQARLNESYARSREVARQGVVPFKFVLAERREALLSPEPSPVKMRRDEPNLIVDVKLSSSKTAKIQIWRGDDPLELASSFARIYSLDLKARDLLVTVIRQSMTENGLLEVPEDASLDINRSSSQDAGELGRTPSSFAGEFAGGELYGLQDAQYVEDDYDSQSSVSESNDGVSSHSSDPDGDDASQGSGSLSGKDSEYLTA